MIHADLIGMTLEEIQAAGAGDRSFKKTEEEKKRAAKRECETGGPSVWDHL